MRTQETIIPSEAWCQSLSRALLWPLAICFFFGLTLLTEGLGGMAFALFVGAAGMVIHFISYFVVGLPVYLCFWRTFPLLWTWQVGLPVGILAGGLTLAGVGMILEGSSSYGEFGGSFLFGGAYGLITAAAAITTYREQNR